MNRYLVRACLALSALVLCTATQAAPNSVREYMSTRYQKLTPAEFNKLKSFVGSTSIKRATSTRDTGSQADLARFGNANATAIWGAWQKVDIPGAVCSDGSPYKIFVMRANSPVDRHVGNDQRLTIQFEPGGACWDYPSCSGQLGVFGGAVHPDGIPDNFMDLYAYLDPGITGGSANSILTPIIMKNHPSGQSLKTAYWNKVFLPYCTGDVFVGNKVTTYADPSGSGKTITYRHAGATNMEKVIAWLQQNFNQPKELLVSGASAGGAGAQVNYHFIRKALNPAKSTLLNDSGPIFPAPGYGNQYPLQQKTREAWNVDYIIGKLEQERPGSGITRDFGAIATLVADLWPQDKIGISLFRRDGIYSAYSYARFYGLDPAVPADKEKLLTMWGEDLRNLMTQYSSRPNMSYYIPYYRKLMDSHCASIVEWNGTEIQAQGVNSGSYINSLLNDATTVSRIESDNPYDIYVPGIFSEFISLTQ
jgi:hypothetical protein